MTTTPATLRDDNTEADPVGTVEPRTTTEAPANDTGAAAAGTPAGAGAGASSGALRVGPWPDPVIDTMGHDPRGAYVEKFWLPVLGPSSILLLRRLADRLEDSPDGFELDLAEGARSLGLGPKTGRHGPLFRTIERCCSFGAARMVTTDHLVVRRRIPPLTRRQIARLPEALRRSHEDWQQRDAARDVEAMRRRCRALALSLLQVGESAESAERQLHRWRYHPAMAHEAMRWAREQMAGCDAPGAC